jgi:hypothetical protein
MRQNHGTRKLICAILPQGNLKQISTSYFGYGESKMVLCENRSGAYYQYVSTGAQKSAICRPPEPKYLTCPVVWHAA